MKFKEIERKFLVKETEFLKDIDGEEIIQGYLSTKENCAIRVRIKNQQAFISIKGKPNSTGVTRYEWEKEIALEEAKSLLKLVDTFLIEKTRYTFYHKGNKFEVDVFKNNHDGLILAEIELENEYQEFEKPSWLGEEVTGLKQYYNVFLAEHSL